MPPCAETVSEETKRMVQRRHLERASNCEVRALDDRARGCGRSDIRVHRRSIRGGRGGPGVGRGGGDGDRGIGDGGGHGDVDAVVLLALSSFR